jgi:hypothetical protein
MESRAGFALSLVAAAAIAGGGLFFVLREGSAIVETYPVQKPPVATPPIETQSPPAIASPAPGPAIYRCESKGKVTYANSPCEGGKLVDATPTQGYESPRSSPLSKKGATLTGPVAPAAQASSEGSANSGECKRLEDAIAWIDSEARQGGTIPRMEELKERRRKLVDRKYELRC